uniref:Cytochrome c oxidase subunit 2 n=1 Tax=Falcolipeurus quadripustulatus TaxID=2358485 RepID=A0A386B2B0_9NEOP|nr:cytochrome c oxidase subunit II [Falcolipeurus quadripustulatus]AYC65873.1 cytochrome c oxidase subunit II [Falcolipeurus quadripustulatus]
MHNIFFQDSWSPVMEYISIFHNHIMIVLIMIISLVLYLFTMIFLYPCSYRLFFESEQLEMIWTVVPGIILSATAIPSLHILYLSDELLDPMLTVKSVGHQWFWSYDYGDFEGVEFDSYMVSDHDLNLGDFRLLEVDNNLILPMNSEVRLIITSSDVIHSWTIPSLGLKVDAIPGRLNQLCLLSNRLGLVYGQCSEICGALHSFMPICLEFVTDNVFMNWILSKG